MPSSGLIRRLTSDAAQKRPQPPDNFWGSFLHMFYACPDRYAEEPDGPNKLLAALTAYAESGNTELLPDWLREGDLPRYSAFPKMWESVHTFIVASQRAGSSSSQILEAMYRQSVETTDSHLVQQLRIRR